MTPAIQNAIGQLLMECITLLIACVLGWALISAVRVYVWLKLNPQYSDQAKGKITRIRQYSGFRITVYYQFSDVLGNIINASQTLRWASGFTSFKGRENDAVDIVYNQKHTSLNFMKGYKNDFATQAFTIFSLPIVVPIFFYLFSTFTPFIAFLLLIPISFVLSPLFQFLLKVEE